MPTTRMTTVTIDYEDEDGVMHKVTAVIAPPDRDVGAFHPSIEDVRCDTLPDSWDADLAADAIWQAYDDKGDEAYYGKADRQYQEWKDARYDE